MLGRFEVTSIETSVAGVTVSVVLPEIDPKVAEMTVEPAETAVARPLESAVATVVDEELQITDVVMGANELSE